MKKVNCNCGCHGTDNSKCGDNCKCKLSSSANIISYSCNLCGTYKANEPKCENCKVVDEFTTS